MRSNKYYLYANYQFNFLLGVDRSDLRSVGGTAGGTAGACSRSLSCGRTSAGRRGSMSYFFPLRQGRARLQPEVLRRHEVLVDANSAQSRF